MTTKTKIAMMTAQQFGQFTRDGKQTIALWSSALLFALSQCSNDKDNTHPLNELLRLPVCQYKNKALRQFGNAVKSYVAKMLGHSVQWQAERGRFQFVKKSETIYIDFSACETFTEFFAKYGAKKARKDSESAPKPASAAAILKLIESARENGITAKNIDMAHALRDSIATLQTAVIALVQDMESKRDDNAATVTDGATGDFTRNEAHAPADVKAETAIAVKPEKSIPHTAIAAAYAKGKAEADRKAA